MSRTTFFLGVLAALALLSGVSVKAVGTLFIGDVLHCAYGALCLCGLAPSAPRVRWRVVVLVGIAAGFAALDLFNGVPVTDTARGAARNGVFALSAIVAASLLRELGYRRALLVFLLLVVAMPLARATGLCSLHFPASAPGVSFFKYEGGTFLCALVPLLLPAALPVQLAGVTVALGAIAGFFDFRSMIVGCCLFAVAMAASVFRIWWVRVGVITLGIGAGVVVFDAADRFLREDSGADADTAKRREMSSLQRSEMNEFALAGIGRRPATGHGSWQFPVNYVDSQMPDADLTVHSLVLEWGYEYGAAGVAVAAWIIGVLVRAIVVCSRIADLPPAERRNRYSRLLLYSLVLVGLAFGGIGGYGKLVVGWVFGFALAEGGEASRPMLDRRFAADAGWRNDRQATARVTARPMVV